MWPLAAPQPLTLVPVLALRKLSAPSSTTARNILSYTAAHFLVWAWFMCDQAKLPSHLLWAVTETTVPGHALWARNRCVCTYKMSSTWDLSLCGINIQHNIMFKPTELRYFRLAVTLKKQPEPSYTLVWKSLGAVTPRTTEKVKRTCFWSDIKPGSWTITLKKRSTHPFLRLNNCWHVYVTFMKRMTLGW